MENKSAEKSGSGEVNTIESKSFNIFHIHLEVSDWMLTWKAERSVTKGVSKVLKLLLVSF